jgi:hypothetical protein
MFSNFITSLAFKSAVCGYIHPSEEVEQLIQSLVKGIDVKCDPVMWQSRHNNIPVLFTLLENSCGSSAPAELRPLLDELWERAMQPFDNCDMIDDSSFVSSNVKRTGMLLWRLCHMTGSHLTSTPFTRLWINCSTSSEG